MNLEERFETSVNEWKEHCEKTDVLLDSSYRKVADCDGYKKIVRIGHKALPLIRKLYDKPDEDFSFSVMRGYFVSLVREILGPEFSVPRELYGRVEELEEYTKKWLDRYMLRYN